MVRDYASRFYFPTSDRFTNLTANNFTPVKELSHWKQKLFEQWYQVRIHSLEVSESSNIEVNQTVDVTAKINLAGLTSQDVKVQLYLGKLNDKGEIINGYPLDMNYQGTQDGNVSIYKTDIHYQVSGLQGLSLRILPHHPYLATAYEAGLILWA
jgi:glycogen phosphorylase